MKKYIQSALTFSFLLLCFSCTHEKSIAQDDDNPGSDAGDTDIPGTDAGSENLQARQYTKVDILLVVDNSKSMEEEQQRLQMSSSYMINLLMDPPVEWKEEEDEGGLKDIRVAVTTTDMGMEVEEDFQGCDSSLPGGNEGAFVSSQDCEDLDDGWVDITTGNLDDIACLTDVGTDGCGFEQQLYAAVYSLQREDHREFLRGDDSILVIIMVTDEEDCSAAHGSSFWDHEEMSPLNPAINAYCARHADEMMDIKTVAHDLKKRGNPVGDIVEGSVIFVGFVGVPWVDDCRGRGDQLDDCLDRIEMQYVEEDDAQGRTYLANACVSEEIDNDTKQPTTAAVPGRRFVELAQEFGEYGYIYSICEISWDPPLEDVAQNIYFHINRTNKARSPSR